MNGPPDTSLFSIYVSSYVYLCINLCPKCFWDEKFGKVLKLGEAKQWTTKKTHPSAIGVFLAMFIPCYCITLSFSPSHEAWESSLHKSSSNSTILLSYRAGAVFLWPTHKSFFSLSYFITFFFPVITLSLFNRPFHISDLYETSFPVTTRNFIFHSY